MRENQSGMEELLLGLLGSAMGEMVVGGTATFPHINSQYDERELAEAKAGMWLELLNDGHRPVRWLDTTNEGTDVEFRLIHSQAEYDEGIEELRAYIEETNSTYDLGIELSRREDQ